MSDGPESPSAFAPGTFMAQLSESERQALLELGVRRRFPHGTVLMYQLEPDERVMFILAGRVKIGRVDGRGRELLLTISDPGDMLGELAFVDRGPRVATVTALEPVEALVTPSQALRSHLESTPRIAVALLEVVAHRYRETTVKLAQFPSLDTMGRLAARVVELADRYGRETNAGIEVILPISQDELAAWTGASRASVAHALQSLRELGWIRTERRKLTVIDLESLRARAE